MEGIDFTNVGTGGVLGAVAVILYLVHRIVVARNGKGMAEQLTVVTTKLAGVSMKLAAVTATLEAIEKTLDELRSQLSRQWTKHDDVSERLTTCEVELRQLKSVGD